jgi:hypothetical protein
VSFVSFSFVGVQLAALVVRALTQRSRVTLMLPSFDGLVTADGSHLARSSAESYAKAFWSQLLARPEVREKLSLDGPAPKADQDKTA